LTGQLGDVMKESAQAGWTYLRSIGSEYNVPEDVSNLDVHIHVPEGAIPKDGPSAGVTMACALASAFSNRPVRSDVAMTGEITLRGRVLAIGGLKEKSIAAHRAGVKTVIIPKDNKKDLAELPQVVRDNVEFVCAENLRDVLNVALV
jgi:ATP-dependent Lon protease